LQPEYGNKKKQLRDHMMKKELAQKSKKVILILAVFLIVAIGTYFLVLELTLKADDSQNVTLYKNSEYVLPYPIGKTYRCWQGRFYQFHNRGKLHNAQDFEMPENTIVTAARSGTVVHTRDNINTWTESGDNMIIIRHSDASFARYVHLEKNGVYVKINQSVKQGDKLAVTGSTGTVGPVPHLHFDVIRDDHRKGIDAQTIPIWFKNTKQHPNGVMAGEYYTAEQY